ncbi:unnamed protein product [Sphagnum jensenii]|uniref:EF-hand domain-containing protein n=1 Tax=Sphagnum jensenii TaxID=128206 RepID=A0ABP1AYN6_9BRYO
MNNQLSCNCWRMQQHFVLVLLLSFLVFATVFGPCFGSGGGGGGGDDDVVVDGILSVVQQSGGGGSLTGGSLEVGSTRDAECEELYGLMPCSTSLGGNLSLLLIYGFMLLKAAQLLSDGSELLLAVLSPGIIGGLVLPILGALPDALLILVSGLGATQAEAQSEVLVGMGLVAGSSVMLLTALWGSCLIVGRCDLVDTSHGKLVAKDRTLNKGFSLFGTGVTTDKQTKWLSWIMMATLLPYVVAQIPRLLGLTAGGSLAVAIAGVLSVLGVIAYCTYQLIAPWIQERRIYWAKHKYKSHVMHRMSYYALKKNLGQVFLEDGATLDAEVLRRFFQKFDQNKDEVLEEAELERLIKKLGIEHKKNMPEKHEIALWMEEFDIVPKDNRITEEEFLKGMEKWRDSVKLTNTCGTNWHSNPNNSAILQEEQEDDDNEDAEEENKALPTKAQIINTAVLYLIAGAALAAFFADPLVDAIGGFSKASGISPFFIAFIATPLATNSSEAISSILFARRKHKKNISMTFSQIYGAVTMNNTLCLGIFLAIVYFRGLVWDFSAEITVILFSTLVMGGLAAVRTTFPLWVAFIAIALYPISIGLVAYLDYVCGWH